KPYSGPKTRLASSSRISLIRPARTRAFYRHLRPRNGHEMTQMSLRHRRPATGLVEYGLVLGAVAVLVIVGLNSLSGAQAGYFASLEPSVAAPPAAPVSGPRHSTSVEQPSGTPGPQCTPTVVSGAQVNCTAFVHDTSATAQAPAPDRGTPYPPTGQVTWSMNGTPV